MRVFSIVITKPDGSQVFGLRSDQALDLIERTGEGHLRVKLPEGLLIQLTAHDVNGERPNLKGVGLFSKLVRRFSAL